MRPAIGKPAGFGCGGAWLQVALALACLASPAAADDDGWGSESGWDELDDPAGKNKTPEEEALPPMMMGAGTLPAGHVAIKLSGGALFANTGVQVGVLDRLDLMAEALTPYGDIGNTWMFGGGAKLNIHGRAGGFQSAVSLRAFGIFYSEAGSASGNLAEGLGLWPSFQIGGHVKGGCFYAELGVFLFPYTSGSSNHSAVFYGLPAHFGGEIYVTDWFHVFINVDLVLFSPVVFFSYALSGPFNMAEGGVIFLF